MGNLLGSLLGASNALRVYERGMSVSQNNVANASTPGYAKERLSFAAKPYQPEFGLAGGVEAGNRVSSRSEFLEQNVRSRYGLYSYSSQTAESLRNIEPILTVQEGRGIPDALNKLFQSFSGLSVAPNDLTARQAVLDSAVAFAETMNSAATELSGAANAAGQQAAGVVGQINDLASRVRALNEAKKNILPGTSDPGVDAQMNSTLEELSGLADVTVLNQPDGTVSVYLGGMTPLVMGERNFPISASTAAGKTTILDSQGNDITGNIQEGSLAALIDVGNTLIPSYLMDLNQLAAGVADSVNNVLAGGLDMNGLPPAQGLFAYGTATDAAFTMSANALAPADIAAAGATAPGGNANALALADLGSSAQISGMTFTEFYGGIAANLGRDLSAAQQNADTHQLLLDQAQQIRADKSGVNLDEEAAHIMELQRAYEAAAQMVSVLNDLADTVINMVR